MVRIGILCLMLTLTASASAQTSGFEVQEATIADIHAALQSHRITCAQLVEKYLDRIARYDKSGASLNSLITINSKVLSEARAMDSEIERTGITKPLQCIPAIVKDNFETIGLPTTAGSLSLAGWISNRDAFQVKKIREAGAIVLAKSNMAEFAFSPYETVGSMLPGYTRNPYALNRVTAGSSGGTAAAVAASFGAVGLGSDTGNSIRGPSSHNDLVGIRSTMGLTSRAGVIPLNFHRDIAGPIARTLTDAVKVFDVIAGYDPDDPYTVAAQNRKEPSYSSALVAGSLKGARIGVARFIIDATADSDVVKLFDQAVAVVKREGAIIVDPFLFPEFNSARPAGCNRFKFDLNDYLASRDPAPPVKDLAAILASRKFHPSIELRLRDSQTAEVHPKDNPLCRAGEEGEERFRQALLAAMDRDNVSAVVYPTWSNPPRLIGDLNTPAGDNSQVLSPASGFPAINVPVGFVRDELPSGMTFLGRAWSEATLIKLAYSYEQATRHRRPPASTPPLK